MLAQQGNDMTMEGWKVAQTGMDGGRVVTATDIVLSAT
jgi:hypothetical protein